MPPPAIKSIKDIIFYQYAKIISESAGYGKKNYGFIMATWKKLKSGEMQWSSTVREWLREHESADTCIYCGAKDPLTTEHILPTSRGGDNVTDNVVRVCKTCNSSKGKKRLYEWKGLENKDQHHRIAEGKYLKYLYSKHEQNGTLDSDNVPELCNNCDMGGLCEKAGSVEKLSVYCLEGCFH